MLNPEDIKVGKTYRAKRFKAGPFGGTNDRLVLWVSRDKTQVQYDSDTVTTGRHYPKVSMEAFIKWAKEAVVIGNPSQQA